MCQVHFWQHAQEKMFYTKQLASFRSDFFSSTLYFGIIFIVYKTITIIAPAFAAAWDIKHVQIQTTREKQLLWKEEMSML